jgi:hypothetical protein
MNEEAMARVGPQRHRGKKKASLLTTKIIKTNLQNYFHPGKIIITFPCTDDVNYSYCIEGWFEYIKIRNLLIKIN